MRLLLITTLLISSVSFAQIAPGTESCFAAALQTASNKIAKDSKTSGSVLNEIGFVAESCQYNRISEMIECSREGSVQFDVVFERSAVVKSQADYTLLTYEFETGTQGVDVHYEVFFKQATSGKRACSYEATEVWTDGYEEAGGKNSEEIKQCIAECFATFDKPGAEFKSCVSKCKE